MWIKMRKDGADMCLSATVSPEAIGTQALALLRRYTLYHHYDISQPDASVLVAIADGYREVLGVAEGMKEDKANWVNFFR